MDLIRKVFDLNPTSHWRADPSLRIELDLGSHSLCGVGVGEPVEGLSGLGPADDWARFDNHHQYVYHSRGLNIGVEEGRVTGYLLYWDSAAYKVFCAFPGMCMYRGDVVMLSAETNMQEFAKQFGEPYYAGTEGGDTMLYYECGDVEWQVVFGPDGKLDCLVIVSPPVLAAQELREAFGVAKPWPP